MTDKSDEVSKTDPYDHFSIYLRLKSMADNSSNFDCLSSKVKSIINTYNKNFLTIAQIWLIVEKYFTI
jgi:hypothetical protein